MEKVLIKWTVKYGLELWINDVNGINKVIECDNELIRELNIKTREYLEEEGV